MPRRIGMLRRMDAFPRCSYAYVQGASRWRCRLMDTHAGEIQCVMGLVPLEPPTTVADALRLAAEIAEGAMRAGHVLPGSPEHVHNLACRQVIAALEAFHP